MKHISILIPNGSLLAAPLMGAYKIFLEVNRFYLNQGKHIPFKVEFIGSRKHMKQYDGAIEFHCHNLIKDIASTDLIVVPFTEDDLDVCISQNQATIDFIRDQYKRNMAQIAAAGSGIYFLAAAGLLDGKPISFKWLGADQLHNAYPEIIFNEGLDFCDYDGITTCGSTYQFIAMILNIIERFCGRDTALWIAKIYDLDMSRTDSLNAAIFDGMKDHNDIEIINAQNYIEFNFYKDLSVEELADYCNFSRRNFIRRFKKATKTTPHDYLQRVKVEAAKKLFERYHSHVDQVMNLVGYSDPKAFRNIFKKISGVTPIDYRKRYTPL
ncbi:MAG TPA: helix-turn-helix domain-containing protein [Bacteroidia bacterium]|nr:helix-turn-helix domain-containing protein [Bacteroidia bacterium]HNT80624.1 helix-turn-helix domain-containing protein [Bacteroidia bacterium]